MGKNDYEKLKAKFFKLFAEVPDPLRDEIIAVIDDDTYTWRTANAEIAYGDQKKAEAILKQLQKVGVLLND